MEDHAILSPQDYDDTCPKTALRFSLFLMREPFSPTSRPDSHSPVIFFFFLFFFFFFFFIFFFFSRFFLYHAALENRFLWEKENWKTFLQLARLLPVNACSSLSPPTAESPDRRGNRSSFSFSREIIRPPLGSAFLPS